MGPGGQKVTVLVGDPGHLGYEVGGPPGSWEMGLIITNQGPGPFPSDPSTQLALVDGAGKAYAPKAGVTTTTGKAQTVAAGQRAETLLIIVLPAGTKPTAVTYTPFGTSGPTLRWTV